MFYQDKEGIIFMKNEAKKKILIPVILALIGLIAGTMGGKRSDS